MHLVADLHAILIYREKIYQIKCSQINSNTPVTTPTSPLIIDIDIIGTSQVGIADIVSLSINNAISIDPLNGAKLNEPS
jgi:hypothetical protein